MTLRGVMKMRTQLRDVQKYDPENRAKKNLIHRGLRAGVGLGFCGFMSADGRRHITSGLAFYSFWRNSLAMFMTASPSHAPFSFLHRPALMRYILMLCGLCPTQSSACLSLLSAVFKQGCSAVIRHFHSLSSLLILHPQRMSLLKIADDLEANCDWGFQVLN